jgi:hypothetical protein
MAWAAARRAARARRFGVRAARRQCPRNLDDLLMAQQLQRGSVMKKSTKNLSLRFQTVRVLANEALVHVAGGNVAPVEHGFIMQDTVIIPTSRR